MASQTGQVPDIGEAAELTLEGKGRPHSLPSSNRGTIQEKELHTVGFPHGLKSRIVKPYSGGLGQGLYCEKALERVLAEGKATAGTGLYFRTTWEEVKGSMKLYTEKEHGYV